MEWLEAQVQAYMFILYPIYALIHVGIAVGMIYVMIQVWKGYHEMTGKWF